MIKTSPAVPAGGIPNAAAVAREAPSRAADDDGNPATFADVLDAQGTRPEGEPSCGALRWTDAAAETMVDAAAAAADLVPSPADATAAAGPTPVPVPSLAPAMVDAMIGLCTPQGSTENAPVAPAEGIAIVSPMMAANPGRQAVAATVAPLAIDDGAAAPAAPALFEAELQQRLALAGSTAAASIPTGLETPDEGSHGDMDESAALEPGSATAAAGGGETRVGARSPATESAPPASRPPELRSPPGAGAWADELGARVSWMLERGEQVASLRLSPENLGPLEVRISVREGEASVWFGAAQAETRAALEQSLPRLREMLGASGLALASAGVFSETPRDPQRGFTAAALARAAHESGAEPVGAVVTQVSRRGLVDLYA